MRYQTPVRPTSPADLGTAKYLVSRDATGSPPLRYAFFERIEVGREEADRELTPGLLLVPGQTVSWSHCVITQTPDGRCLIQDLSRNGTRVDGRRLVPNVQEEIRVGQTLTIGTDKELVLEGDRSPAADTAMLPSPSVPGARGRTVSVPDLAEVTVLVGDIRDYTVLVREVASAALQRSVTRVFERLTELIALHGGTVKEYQGDAILALWEKDDSQGDRHVLAACRAALAADRLALDIAADPSIWELRDRPLRFDWALTTGPVTIDSFGGTNPMGLSVIGKPVVLAYRLEKLVDDRTGPIVVCTETRAKAAPSFRFKDLGAMLVKGFDEAPRVFALDGQKPIVAGRATASQRVLVTGATGYVGGRLIPRLLAEGHEVACMTRDPSHLAGREWPGVELRQADALSARSLMAALEGTEVAYYLIHLIAAGDGRSAERDRAAAENFGMAAKAAGVRRIIYLGALGTPEQTLSPYLASRHEVGEILRSSGVPVTEFRAAMIIGSGSVSFEVIRYITEGFPVVLRPTWMTTRAQPIAISNVIDYLVLALDEPRSAGRILEIGGLDVLTYEEMVRSYAAERLLRRAVVPLPVLTPGLSSLLLHLFTSIPANFARPLVEAMCHELIVRDHAAEDLFAVPLVPYREAVRRALTRIETGDVETFWSGAHWGTATGVRLTFAEGMMVEERRLATTATPAAVFTIFSGIGGERGWFYANWGWELRGLLDRLVGGVGLRRGRRNPDRLRQGDALDFWRVEALEPGRLMRLRAEMKLPGRGWLQFEALPTAGSGTQFILTAFFEPHGFLGLLYWYLLYPLHRPFFSGLARQIVRRAEAMERQSAGDQ